jgi:hypothetical protein
VVRDTTPHGAAAYHARFLFDPNGFGLLRLGAAARRGARAVLFDGYAQGGTRPLFQVLLDEEQGRLVLGGRASSDGGPAQETIRVPVSDAPHVIDLGWRRASGPGANDGLLLLARPSATR